MSLALQYTLVAAIVLGACIWMLFAIIRLHKRNSCASKDENPSCGGCALSDACKSPKKEKKKP